MTLKAGYYSFRLVSTKNPDPGVGGMYATDNGKNQQVLLETIEEVSRQKWYVTPEAGEEGIYRISKCPLEPGILGFMMRNASVNLITIVLNVLPERWRFRLVEKTTHVFTIHAYSSFPGVETLIGSKGDPRGLVIEHIISNPDTDMPAWELRAVDD